MTDEDPNKNKTNQNLTKQNPNMWKWITHQEYGLATQIIIIGVANQSIDQCSKSRKYKLMN